MHRKVGSHEDAFWVTTPRPAGGPVLCLAQGDYLVLACPGRLTHQLRSLRSSKLNVRILCLGHCSKTGKTWFFRWPHLDESAILNDYTSRWENRRNAPWVVAIEEVQLFLHNSVIKRCQLERFGTSTTAWAVIGVQLGQKALCLTEWHRYPKH